MNAIGHRRIARQVDAYIDGELPPHQRPAVAAHLRRCWRCSGYAETARLIRHSLSRLPRRGPALLTEARLRRYATRLAGTPSSPPGRPRPGGPPGPAGPAAG